MKKTAALEQKKDGGKVSDYLPLIALILITFSAAAAINYNLDGNLMQFMHYFMGLFLCSFAMLKIFRLEGFADGFSMYDIIAKKTRIYAYIYPFIELGLGLAYLAFFYPTATYIITVIVMSIGIIGVILALKEGLNINCPCMGSTLEVPLSTVTLTEDIAMALMALIMLINIS